MRFPAVTDLSASYIPSSPALHRAIGLAARRHDGRGAAGEYSRRCAATRTGRGSPILPASRRFSWITADPASIAATADAVLEATGGRLGALYNNGAYGQARRPGGPFDRGAAATSSRSTCSAGTTSPAG